MTTFDHLLTGNFILKCYGVNRYFNMFLLMLYNPDTHKPHCCKWTKVQQGRAQWETLFNEDGDARREKWGEREKTGPKAAWRGKPPPGPGSGRRTASAGSTAGRARRHSLCRVDSRESAPRGASAEPWARQWLEGEAVLCLQTPPNQRILQFSTQAGFIFKTKTNYF